ncbi:MAG: protein-glutamate methylesterase/protein-glutamine glutaminase [Chloroflexia bacterium]
MGRTIRVLVVDDSAYIRKVVSQMLSRSPVIEVVGTARDGREALEKVVELDPDVVTLDLIMPELDGVGFLREQMARRPIPVVVVSIASETGELAFQALQAGAVDFVQKPTALATERVFEISDELVEKVKAAAAVSVDRLKALTEAPPAPPLAPPARPRAGPVDIVVIGVSTGGPQALRFLIPQLPPDFPVPVAIVLHMPVGYTELYAQKLDEVCPLKVVEAREGDEARPGVVLLAPAGRHLTLVRTTDERVTAHLDIRPMDTLHRPSADVLFRSAAETYDGRVLGVVLTGMGSDGKEGAAWIKARGGLVFTEAEETCVVYGMPRSVAEAGLSDRSIPLHEMARAILEVV